MIAPSISPPLRMRATLERNTESGLSPTRQPLPPTFEVIDTGLACHYWEPERAPDQQRAGLREGPNIVAVAIGPRLLTRRSADVQIGDRVTEVRWRTGDAVISREPMRVIEVLWRQTHQDVGLELIGSGPVQDGGGS